MSENLISATWKFSEKLFFRFSFAFVLLFVNSFSFVHNFLPDIGHFTHSFFEVLVKWTGAHIFNIQHPYYYQLVSDSLGFYINAFNLFFISIFIAAIWSALDRKRTNYDRLQYFFFVFIRYYLALQLFEYGFNKIFKLQFYWPEPNTLFTTIGNTSKDLLYWSSMGTSRFYVVFSGMLEIFAAIFLLFRKTALFGAIVSLGVMINVLMINFGFDISVKLYSCFLILLCVLLILPDAKRLFQFFFSNKKVEDRKPIPEMKFLQKRFVYLPLKILVVFIIVFDPLFPYLKAGNFNDDVFPRPYMHGAYDVTLFVKNSDTLLPLQTDPVRWKRVFIHRQGYFIIQNMNDEMEDFQLENYREGKKLLLVNYDASVKTFFNYNQTSDSTFTLQGNLRGDSLTVHLRKIDLEKLPISKTGFEWTIGN